MPCIYKIENLVNHKVYIGQTMSTLDWRLNSQWIGHFPLAFERNSKMRTHCALRKYGKDCFSYLTIEEKFDGTFEELHKWLDEREKYWIEQYDSTNRLRGYNSTKGGTGVYSSHKALSETLKKTRRDTMTKNETSPAFKKWINNGTITKQVHRDEVQMYLDRGWSLGRLKKTIKSKKETKYKKGFGNKNGAFNKGKKRTKEQCRRLSEMRHGKLLTEQSKLVRRDTMTKNETSPAFKKWINNSTITKQVHRDEVQMYLDRGWSLGRLKLKASGAKRKPVSEETRKLLSIKNRQSKLGRVYIHKEDKVKMVKKEELQDFLDNGWSLGRKIDNRS